MRKAVRRFYKWVGGFKVWRMLRRLLGERTGLMAGHGGGGHNYTQLGEIIIIMAGQLGNSAWRKLFTPLWDNIQSFFISVIAFYVIVHHWWSGRFPKKPPEKRYDTPYFSNRECDTFKDCVKGFRNPPVRSNTHTHSMRAMFPYRGQHIFLLNLSFCWNLVKLQFLCHEACLKYKLQNKQFLETIAI